MWNVRGHDMFRLDVTRDHLRLFFDGDEPCEVRDGLCLEVVPQDLFADVPVEIVAVRDNCQVDTATATVENGRIFVIKEDKLWGGRYEALLYLLGPQNGL